MGLFKDLFKKTYIYCVYDFLYATYTYLTDKNLVYETLHSKGFETVINKYFHTKLRSNWFGDVGCVINPYIGENGDLDVSTMIVEIDGDNTNTSEYVKIWAEKQLYLIKTLFKLDSLYEYINIDLKHVGPVNQDNYLMMFTIASKTWFKAAAKKFWWRTLTLGGIAGIIILILQKYFT